MTHLTIERVRAAATDDEVFELLGAELERRLPDGRTPDDRFVSQIRALPPGLRAMAATYELDVSLALNDEAWRLWHETNKGLFTYWITYARQFPERLM